MVKRILIMLILFISILLSGYAQKNDNGIIQRHPVETLYLSGIDAFNSHEVETFLQQFADDAEMYTNNGWYRGLSCIKERFTHIFQQFPSIKMEITDLQVREVIKGTAVIDFNWKVSPNGNGPAWSGVGSGVYILRNDRWVEVLEHETVVHIDEELNSPGK